MKNILFLLSFSILLGNTAVAATGPGGLLGEGKEKASAAVGSTGKIPRESRWVSDPGLLKLVYEEALSADERTCFPDRKKFEERFQALDGTQLKDGTTNYIRLQKKS